MPSGESVDLLLKVLVAAATLAAPFLLWTLRLYVRWHRLTKEHAELRTVNRKLEGRLEEAYVKAHEPLKQLGARFDQLRLAYNEARTKFYRIKTAYLAVKSHAETRSADAEFGSATITELQAELTAREQELAELQSRLDDASKFDGRLWLRPPLANMPAFRPLSKRSTIVISILNLKGGVGKTTITANLAATLAMPNKSVLMIDLDYQRSLTMLLLPDDVRTLMHKAGLSLQHFLEGGDHSFQELARHVRPLEFEHCDLLPNSDPFSEELTDSLEEVENRLMTKWFFDPNHPDPRYFLRNALHDAAIDRRYKYVLLDCPPRLTTACVNALAASDFVLIPVGPDSLSTRAVENLLRTLKRLRSVLPNLAVLAIVPNMVRLRNEAPIAAHRDAINSLRGLLAYVWPEEIPIVKSVIPHNSAFGESAAAIDTNNKARLAIADNDVKRHFRSLMKELEREIARHENRIAAAVPA